MKRVIASTGNTAPKKYEVEVQRSNITPREFWWYCKQRMKAKGADLESWIGEYKDWVEPKYPEPFT